MADSITAGEFLKLIKWADTAKKDSDFWKRVLSASAAYPIEQQIRIAELVKQYGLGDK